MRILQVIDEATIGGGQMHVLALAKELHHRGISVEVACAPAGFLVDQLQENRIPAHAVVMSNQLRLQSWQQMQTILKKGCFSVVHTHGGTAGFWGRLAVRFPSAPTQPSSTVHTYHGLHALQKQQGVKGQIFLHLDRLLLRFTDRVICVSLGDYDSATQAGLADPGKAVLIPNGIDLHRFSLTRPNLEVRHTYRIPPDTFLLGAVGRLHPQKGLEFLLRAMPEVLHRLPNTLLLIVGSGEAEADLRALANSLDLGDRIRFVGESQEIPHILAGLDLLVFPSLWEGLPLILLEAGAASTPILATDISGNNEIIEHQKSGWLVPPQNSRALARAICELGHQPELREQLGQQARIRVQQTFSESEMVERTLILYQELLART